MKNQQCKLFHTETRRRVSLTARLVVWALAITAPGIASAGVIFTNFGAVFSYDVTSGNPVGNAFDSNNYAEGVSFTPSGTGNLSSISLALSCFFVCSNSFTVDLTADARSQPGAIIESFSLSGAALGLVGNNNPPEVAVSVLKPLLTAGTTYWITTSSPLTDSITWNFDSIGDTSPEALSIDEGATWFSPSGFTPGALQVNSTPEPATALLVGSIILAVAFHRRLSGLTGSR
jgi:hypothetical protein